MCRVLEVSSSGFYDWLGREESASSRSNRVLLLEIKAVYKKSERRYGSPRVYHQLRKGDRVACSENHVARLMRKSGIQAARKRRFKVTTDQPSLGYMSPVEFEANNNQKSTTMAA